MQNTVIVGKTVLSAIRIIVAIWGNVTQLPEKYILFAVGRSATAWNYFPLKGGCGCSALGIGRFSREYDTNLR
jgi:hypothetical protein